jgi:PLP dependent protein
MNNNIKQNISNILENIKNFSNLYNKNYNEINLIAVSKTIEIEIIKKAIDCDIKILGENKVQEIEKKFDEINEYAGKTQKKIEWHLIGHLQSNKAKKAVKMCDMIHSVDSIEILKDINKYAKEFNKIQNVLIQINVSGEESKSGLEFMQIFNFFDELLKNKNCYSNIKVLGLMTMAPLTNNKETIEDCFLKTNIVFETIKTGYKIDNFIEMKFLSMGMSSDYELAIKNGSNMIRIGQSIFGERIYNS